MPFLLIGGVILSIVFAVSSYIFTDQSISIMLGQSKPAIPTLIGTLQSKVPLFLVNQIALALVLVLGVIGVMLVFSKKAIGNKTLALIVLIPSILVFAYPVVSRDIFSYLYYAKMVLVYHQNPYVVAPASFWGVDMWLGFLHNVERVYAYGPIALLTNLMPMAIVGAEKFIVNVYVLKIVNLAFFLYGAWLLMKITKNRNFMVALWLLNPYIINELLINGHNDLMMIVFFWAAIYLKQKSKNLMATLAYTLSVATKYVTVVLFPIFFMPKKLQKIMALATIIVIGGYFSYNGYLPWYYTWIYFCLPFLKLNKPQILSLLYLQLALTLMYSGYMQNGLWGTYPSSQILVIVIRSTKTFVPLFVIATVYPYFWSLIKTRRFS